MRLQAGHTITELLTAVAIVLILTAFAVPTFMNTVALTRMRDAGVGVSALVQQARYMAEKQNVTIAVYAGNVRGNFAGAFVNCSNAACPSGGNGTTWQAGDPDVAFSSSVVNAAATNAPAPLSPGFVAEPAGTILYFNPRGLPVLSTGTPSTGVIFYFTDSSGHWSAVSVSGAGRSKVWTWHGQGWGS
jgi:Tfp pilus assembly protein FimT